MLHTLPRRLCVALTSLAIVTYVFINFMYTSVQPGGARSGILNFGLLDRHKQKPRPVAASMQPIAKMRSSYSLWLEPDKNDPLYDQLVKEMDGLSKAFDGPRFDPHVTLLGRMQMDQDQAVKAAERIARKLKPYTLRLQSVGRGTFFFQCIFIRVEQEPHTMEAAALAQKECGMELRPYMPHLSLLYADLDDKKKEEVAAASHERLFQREDSRLRSLSFPVTKLSLWLTPEDAQPSLSTWRKIADFRLGGQ